jgi:hypothetical protein
MYEAGMDSYQLYGRTPDHIQGSQLLKNKRLKFWMERRLSRQCRTLLNLQNRLVLWPMSYVPESSIYNLGHGTWDMSSCQTHAYMRKFVPRSPSQPLAQ